MPKRITKVVTKTALKFGQEQARSQFFETATPGVVISVEAPFLWIAWKGETQGVPLTEVVRVEGEEAPAKKVAAA